MFELIEPVVKSMGLELEDLELKRTGSKALLRVYIEKENGVNIDECAQASREISALLDVEDPLPAAYVLEVSSPGLDRALKELRHFKKYQGRLVRVVISEPIEKQTFFVGKLAKAGDTEIVIELPKGMEITVPYSLITNARLEVEYK